MTTGEKIKENRVAEDMTQRQLAETAGTTQQSIGQYEMGKRIPTEKTLKKIAKALYMDWTELISDNNEERANWEYDIEKRTLKKNGTAQTFDMAIGAMCKLIQVWSEWCRYDRFPSAKQEEELSQAIASASILIDQLRISRGIEVEDMRYEILKSLEEELNEEGSATNE